MPTKQPEDTKMSTKEPVTIDWQTWNRLDSLAQQITALANRLRSTLNQLNLPF